MTFAATSATTVAGLVFALTGAFANAGTVIQTRRLTQSETTSSIVFYFSLICALAGLVTWPFGWLSPTGAEFAVLCGIGILGGMAHIFLTESYRYASASVVAPFDYTSMIWALILGYVMFGETPTVMIFVGSLIICTAGLFVIWRERQLAAARKLRGRAAARRDPRQASRIEVQVAPNALKVRMVRVSAMPGTVCTFSAMKWPMSIAGST